MPLFEWLPQTVNFCFVQMTLFSMNLSPSAYHYAHSNAGSSAVDCSVDLWSANPYVAVEGDGAYVEKGADAGGQTQ